MAGLSQEQAAEEIGASLADVVQLEGVRELSMAEGREWASDNFFFHESGACFKDTAVLHADGTFNTSRGTFRAISAEAFWRARR